MADTATLERTASTQILLAAQQAIARAGAFHLVLAGGSTPRRVYQALGQSTADWPHWHVWFGDERCLPAQDSQRNSHMAAEAWLDQVPIPAAQIHPIAAELGAVPIAWSATPGQPTLANGTNVFSVPISVNRKFYRLRRP